MTILNLLVNDKSSSHMSKSKYHYFALLVFVYNWIFPVLTEPDVIQEKMDISFQDEDEKLSNHKSSHGLEHFSSNYNYGDNDYYSVDEVALGSETYENTVDSDHQIDRLDVDYENYEYIEDETPDIGKTDYEDTNEDEEPEYELYYYYYYDYVDPKDLQSAQRFEKLPKPSFQVSTNMSAITEEVDKSR